MKIGSFIFLLVLLAVPAALVAQVVDPDSSNLAPREPDKPVFDEVPGSKALDDVLIAACISDQQAQNVIKAYRVQASEHDSSDCTENAYFRSSQIRTYLLSLVNSTPLDQLSDPKACVNLNNSLVTLFAQRGRNAISGTECRQNVVRCSVTTSGSNLNFRHFPHVGNNPPTQQTNLTRKDQLVDGASVTVGQRYRGWAYVSASGVSNSESVAGWVSEAHISNCQP